MKKTNPAPTSSKANYPEEDTSRIVAELTTARDLASIREAREEDDSARVLERPELLANQRAASQLIEYQMAKSGFDTSQFAQILAKNQADSLRLADEQRATAIKQSASRLKNLQQAIDKQRELLEAVIAQVDDPEPTRVVLEKPFLIWPTRGMELTDVNVAPYHSMAKITMESSKTLGREELGFYFIWRNPRDRFAVVNIDTLLMFHGQLEASQGGGFWPGSRSASISAEGRLHVFEWWNHPPTEPFLQTDQTQSVANAHIGGGGFGDVGGIIPQDVFRTVSLGYSHFLMPPNAVTVIEVTAGFPYSTGSDSGRVRADFNSGDFQLACPYVLIGILT